MPTITQESTPYVRTFVEASSSFSVSGSVACILSFVATTPAVGQGGDVDVTADGSVMISAGGGISIGAQGSMVPNAGQVTIKGGTAGGVCLTAGVPTEGPSITLEPAMLVLRVGEVGAGSSIVMTLTSINFQVGDTELVITAPSIWETVGEVTRVVMVSGKHVLTAGETILTVGVEGITKEGPGSAEAFEGAVSKNATTSEVTIDGVRTEQAAVQELNG